jgi:hypothetical protein
MSQTITLRGQWGLPPGIQWYYKKLDGVSEVADIYTTPIVIAEESSPAAGQAGKKLAVYYTAWKMTPGSTVFDFPTMSGSFGFIDSPAEGAIQPSRSEMNQTNVYVVEKVGLDANIQTGSYTKTLTLGGGTPPTQGDGVIEVWVGYKFVDLEQVGQ